MYSSKIKTPGSWTKQKTVRAYRLQRWFVDVGVPIVDHETQQDIIDTFCYAHGHHDRHLDSQIAYVMWHFDKFKRWACRNWQLGIPPKPLKQNIKPADNHDYNPKYERLKASTIAVLKKWQEQNKSK